MKNIKFFICRLLLRIIFIFFKLPKNANMKDDKIKLAVWKTFVNDLAIQSSVILKCSFKIMITIAISNNNEPCLSYWPCYSHGLTQEEKDAEREFFMDLVKEILKEKKETI